MAIVAALYPLWGAFVACALVISYSIPVDGVLRQVIVLLVWVVLAAIEGRVFRIPVGRHILGGCVAPLGWLIWSTEQNNPLYPAVLVSEIVSRSAAIALAWVSRPDSAGMVLTRRVNSVSALIAIVFGSYVAFTRGYMGIVMVLACFLIVRIIREWYYRRFGGITPTAFSLAQRATELALLLIAALMPRSI